MKSETSDIEAPEASIVREVILVENATIYPTEIDHINESAVRWKPYSQYSEDKSVQAVLCVVISTFFVFLGIVCVVLLGR
jgi:hypothetical protein